MWWYRKASGEHADLAKINNLCNGPTKWANIHRQEVVRGTIRLVEDYNPAIHISCANAI